MDQNNNNSPPDMMTSAKGFLERVLANEAARKGIAAAGAGVLVAAITEALWPSNR